MDNSRLTLWLVIAVLAAAAVFLALPQLDPAASALFAVEGQGFPLNENRVFDLVRRVVWGLSIAMVLLALTAALLALTGRQVAGIPGRLWGSVLALYVLGPGLLVEWGLKGHWGRARPAHVTEFGGTADYTPFWDATDQCQRNCSFVGGESSGAMALAISLLLILTHLRARLAPGLFRAGQGLALLMPLVAGFHRIATGRHFLSDVVFSLLFMALLAALLARLLPPLPMPGPTVDNPPDSP